MSQRIRPPFRADVVGSFLRPVELKAARAGFAAGRLTKAELDAVTDAAVKTLVAQEKAAGLQAVTDGEFPRALWHTDFLEALDGVEHVDTDHWSVAFKGHAPKGLQLSFTKKIGFPADHPFLAHFARVKAAAGDTLVKFTIPSPSMLHLIPCVRGSETYQPIERYRDEDVFFDDLVETYRDALKAFYAAGCRYLQLDDTSWGEFCDAGKRKEYADRGIDLSKVTARYVDVINRVLEGKPEDLTVTMHICRGNFRSTWFSSGAYTPVAETLFGHCKVDGFFLEFDSDRAGGFEPLEYIRDQIVVLGLVTSKTGVLEDPAAVKARIAEAAKFVPLEQLCLSPQCGFASTEEGNDLTEEAQWAKIALIRAIAKEVWGD